jgi:hypothetical protein
VSRSTAEAEFRAVALGICELLWIKKIMSELRIRMSEPMCLYSDSKADIDISNNPVQHDRTKHIEVDRHFIKEKVTSGSINLSHVQSKLQVADIFTKGLPKTNFQNCVDKLGMLDIYLSA